MNHQIRAYYHAAPLRGYIHIVSLQNNMPAEFELKLLHDSLGPLAPPSIHPSVNAAINSCIQYNYLPGQWDITSVPI